NTWATPDQAITNGTYWWHVRAVSKNGDVSAWSAARAIRKEWSLLPRLVSPSNGAEIRFPTTPLVLRWSAVPYSVKYLLSLATDSDLGTLVGDKTIETEGLSYAPSVTLATGTYYWAVTPVDSHGNRGVRSRVASFRWAWRSATRPTLRDLDNAPEHFDPQLAWTRVPGAARYEVEINPSHEWAIGSKVCCKDAVVTTSVSPTQILGNNRYYWRVRAINVDGNAGAWNEGPAFTKVFDNVDGAQPPLSPPSVKNAHMRDNFGDGGPKPAGWATGAPIAVWDSVPGASSYQVDVSPFNTADRPGDCDWVARNHSDRWQVDTAVPAWTPQSYAKTGNAPYPARNINPTNDGGKRLVAGQPYCVRIRARSDKDLQNREIFGDYTYFPDPARHQPAFTFAGYTGGSGSPNAGPGTYGSPVNKVQVTRTPYFTWQPIPGAASYWIIVAKDASFTNVVDYALTNIPAYAPRHGSSEVTYSDEETLYYWALLPAARPDGAGAAGDPLAQAPQSFEKQSIPPTVNLPRERSVVVGPPTFGWTPVEGAKKYRLQVSQDRNFGTLLDEVLTNSTAYTTTKTYPANAALYMRVRAEDETGVELSWSKLRTFRDTLARPVPSRDNPKQSDLLPTWTWTPVAGALSYDIHVDLPDGSTKDFSNLLPAAFTPTEMRGTGVFHWQVRAEFPDIHGSKAAVGPYTRRLTFIRTIQPPSGARAAIGARSVLISWAPKIGADHYKVEIATSPDFSHKAESRDTETTAFAPTLTSGSWSEGGKFYWRVAAVDGSGNSGNFTPVRTFTFRLPK
ncbi:MAG TPA: hypothetical protein VNN79_01735, partial [Actinomycetota bacterium]|nr:hypothetical protein [Actinomycetota bacterium]